MDALPAEYRHEPALALAAGPDGLDVVRRILAEAGAHLNPGGVIAIEVGHNQDLVTAAFPELNAVWLDTEHAAGKIFLVTREDLPPAP
jgi:ribosomal protein L3 glutamine methyltransferase